MEVCNVCIDQEGVVCCADCGWISCADCTETYLLGSHRPYNHCMKCCKRWILQDYCLSDDFKKGSLFMWRRELFYRRELRYIREMIKKKNNNHSISNSFFRHGCPKENCVGYIEETTQQCIACESKVCHDCHVLFSEEDHACRKEDVENWKTICKNTRPCPQCSVPIQRSSGCYQMWCIHCHYAFDFTTGRELSHHSSFHNPHFIEYLKQQTRESLHDRSSLIRSIRSSLVEDDIFYSFMSHKEKSRWLRFMNLLYMIRNRCDFQWFCDPLMDNDDGQWTLDAREQYLGGHISIDRFKDRVYEKMMEIGNRWEMSCFWNRVVCKGEQLLLDMLKHNLHGHHRRKKHMEMHVREVENVLLKNNIGCFLDFSIVFFSKEDNHHEA